MLYFNPRSHCRERLAMLWAQQIMLGISIHVPIAGNDDTGKPFDVLIHFISIHVPIAGNDKFSEWLEECNEEFQYTFPLQGTTCSSSFPSVLSCISIHVPIAGNDPTGGAIERVVDISIHVPIAGNDSSMGLYVSNTGISIHVPIAGNDRLNPHP